MQVEEIVISLARRGFTSGMLHGHEDQATQVLAVDEELGEVARMLRRIRQGVDAVDRQQLADEAVDVLIAATCLASMACGPDLGRIISAKLARDEARGYLHRGGPLRTLPLFLDPQQISSGAPSSGVQALAGEAAQARRDDLGDEKAALYWLALRVPEGYQNGLEVLGLFSAEHRAVAACTTALDVVGPVWMDVNVADLDNTWPARYPVLGSFIQHQGEDK